jgi:hypothetical protein
LANFPITEYQLIGQYYLVWSEGRNSKYGIEALERIAEQTQTYKTQALTSRAAFEVYKNEPEAALYFYTEALKTAPTVSEYIGLTLGIAVIKGIEGFHALALKDMENALPLIRHAEPQLFFNFHNSYATELAVIGRISDARNLSRMVLASPFAYAYPEWLETARELKEPNHSFVAVPSIEYEPIEIEARPKIVPIHPQQPIEPEEPAKVISFPGPELREAPRPNQPKRVKRDELSEMTPSQKRELLLLGIKSGRIVEGEYNKLLFITGMVEGGPSEHVIDLEDKALLKGIVMHWCNLVEPEQFAAVMSALRDCTDDLRRKEIIDSMITIAYEQTAYSTDSEREWRQKFECRLPEK